MGLFDAFMGNSQRKDLARGRMESEAALQAAKNQSIGTTNQFLDRSLQFLAPGAGAGGDAINQLRAALGLDGAGAQQEFFGNFMSDPGFEATTRAGIDAFENSAAARGGLFSGGTIKGVSDRGALRRNDAFNNRINQLLGLSQIGQGAASGSAGLTADAGNRIADTQFGTGQLMANNATNFANAMAASRSIPINNLLGVANAGARVAGAAFGMPGVR